jgi:hypothetical protein
MMDSKPIVELTAAEYVASLPQRTAHVVHALMASSRDHNMPVTAAEICLYDSEALSVRATGMALAHARKLRLAVYTGKYWIPSFVALDMRHAFEERFLDETEEL